MRVRLRNWTMGLLAGLFALAIVPAPAEHARAVVERAAFAVAYAMPDGTLPDICGEHDGSTGHEQHLLTPACYACVIMAAPGLVALPLAAATRVATALETVRHDRDTSWLRQFAETSRQARAPPVAFIA